MRYEPRVLLGRCQLVVCLAAHGCGEEMRKQQLTKGLYLGVRELRKRRFRSLTIHGSYGRPLQQSWSCQLQPHC